MANPTNTSGPANAGAGNSPAAPKAVTAEVKQELQTRKKRRPMSIPVRRLEASEIPGYHLHWIREPNIPQALAAHYEFVEEHESVINTRNVGVDSMAGVSNDLSNRISVQHGGDTLYLMKLREEFFKEDMAVLASSNREIWEQIFRGEQVAGQAVKNPGDSSHTYLKEATVNDSGKAINPHDRSHKPLMQRQYK